MSVPIPKGVFDILPCADDVKEPWRDSEKWQYIESIIRQTTKSYGYKEIRTPIFERTELFKRGVGEGTDIVTKEMYTFEDKGGRWMTLRPEGTAAVMRCAIEKKLYNDSPWTKLFYMGPMFRYERPQAGRYRQHHQFGIEAIGNKAPEQDVEVIDLVYALYRKLGLKDLTFSLNSVGDNDCRQNYRKALRDYLQPHLSEMSPDSQTRFDANPLRILDSKDERDKKLVATAPNILDFLNEECRDHFETLKKSLDLLKIPYQINPLLVRGLDYYDKTVFEIVSNELGAQNSIGGGGRFDGLIRSLGGSDVPAVGFATGLERVIQTMLGQGASFPERSAPTCFFIPLSNEAKAVCMQKVHELRQKGVVAEMDLSGKKLKVAMRYADNVKAKYVIVMGEDELKKGCVELKDMIARTSQEVSLKELTQELTQQPLETNS
ncbi:Histidine--tRNA ligase [Chlamydiales bacterium SCGC AG-110-M15]|nr:Histidine--tRNA ligase [Chlamydiales bacterium SCGC AG-110-M15]